MNDHYDVIIIGTGAGGGTLLHKLAPSGKQILVLERGGFDVLRKLKASLDPNGILNPGKLGLDSPFGENWKE